MEHHARLGDLAEGRLALDHDQRSVVLGGQQAAGPGDLGGDVADDALVGPAQEPGERADPADPVEGPAELRLEDDDEGEDTDQRAGLEDLAQQAEVEEAGRGVDEEHDRDADHQAHGPGPADQAEEAVDEEGGDPDVDDGVELDLVEDRLDELHQAQSRSGTQSCESAVVRQEAGRGGAQPITHGSVARQLHQPAEEEELVAGQLPPAAGDVQLDQDEVEVRIVGRQAEGRVGGIEGGLVEAGRGQLAARATRSGRSGRATPRRPWPPRGGR